MIYLLARNKKWLFQSVQESLLSFYGNSDVKMRRKMYSTYGILHLLHFTVVHMYLNQAILFILQ